MYHSQFFARMPWKYTADPFRLYDIRQIVYDIRHTRRSRHADPHFPCHSSAPSPYCLHWRRIRFPHLLNINYCFKTQNFWFPAKMNYKILTNWELGYLRLIRIRIFRCNNQITMSIIVAFNFKDHNNLLLI